MEHEGAKEMKDTKVLIKNILCLLCFSFLSRFRVPEPEKQTF